MPGAVQVAHPSGAGSGGRRAAKVVERKPGEYPDAARRAGLEGVVLLLVEVLHDGKVGQVAVQESSGVAELDAAARRAVRNWRFEPARESDQPVVSWAVVKYRYTFADR
jgi:protein TonB